MTRDPGGAGGGPGPGEGAGSGNGAGPSGRLSAGAGVHVVRFAPAKLNLTLAVLGRRDDGYHSLHSIMVPLLLGDALTVSVSPAAAAGVMEHVAGPSDMEHVAGPSDMLRVSGLAVSAAKNQ